MEQIREEKFRQFAAWSAQYITGDEKGQAQIFLDRLFQAFGQRGILEVGGTPEFRIRKSGEDGGGVAFADYVWKQVVLIEMKKRGSDLSKHYVQARDYWFGLAPKPKYVILCNFDDFLIYDFDRQPYDPVDSVSVEDLPRRYGAMNFLSPLNEKPIFGNDREPVTRAAADKLAECFNQLIARKVERGLAQRFILQVLVALFAEDIGLLPKYLLDQLLEDCKSPVDSYDLLGGLFDVMNNPTGAVGGRYKGVRYFNGGLFKTAARIELSGDELDELKLAAKADWSKVSPEIFGTLFEHSLGKEARHAFGAHFTAASDIMKIVKPTIIDPWQEQIEGARTLKRLLDLQQRMTRYHVLDPACGSGNFLYIAYRELKRLEARILERLMTEFASQRSLKDAPKFSFVLSKQFFGIDVNFFAVELAKVTMMIARKLAIDELHITENALPLDNLDDNFIATDALIASEPLGLNGDRTHWRRPLLDSSGKPVRVDWPSADVVIGNPPFNGSKKLKPDFGPEYVNALRRAYPDIPGLADLCVFWFRRTQDHLVKCTDEDPLTGHAGLVGTQNVRNNQSRVGGLDHVAAGGTIIDAVENQPWSGEANVHVSIVNWVKTKESELLPKKRRLWSAVSAPVAGRRKRGQGSSGKLYQLRMVELDHINSALSGDTDVSGKLPLACNKQPKRCFQGKIPGCDGFLVDVHGLRDLGGVSKVVVPYLTGRELLDEFRIERWAIDFGNRDLLAASSFEKAFAHCRRHVLPAVQQVLAGTVSTGSDMEVARREHLDRWWQFWNRRDELSEALRKIQRYIGCSRVTRRPIMVFLSSEICPSDLVQVFAFDDDYSFGIVQSAAHFLWFRKSSRLKVESDTRYSVREVFDTFPWPQGPTRSQVEAVAQAARELRNIRSAAVVTTGGGLRAVYRTLELPGKHPLKDAHAALDAAVLVAYGFSTKTDLLEQLLSLNRAVAARITRGECVTAPGIPARYGDRGALVSQDCLTP